MQDLRRQRERDQAVMDELIVSRDEGRLQAAALEAKRVELEKLLKVRALHVLAWAKGQRPICSCCSSKYADVALPSEHV